jgi:hypothetical protein
MSNDGLFGPPVPPNPKYLEAVKKQQRERRIKEERAANIKVVVDNTKG